MCKPVPGKVRKGFGFPGTRLIEACEVSYAFWELNLGLQQKQVLLNAMAVLQPLGTYIISQSSSPVHLLSHYLGISPVSQAASKTQSYFCLPCATVPGPPFLSCWEPGTVVPELVDFA